MGADQSLPITGSQLIAALNQKVDPDEVTAGGGQTATHVTTASRTVTAPGDYIADVATTLTIGAGGSTVSLAKGQAVYVTQIGSTLYASAAVTLYAGGTASAATTTTTTTQAATTTTTTTQAATTTTTTTAAPTWTTVSSSAFTAADGTAVTGLALTTPSSSTWAQFSAGSFDAQVVGGKAKALGGANNQLSHIYKMSTAATVGTVTGFRRTVDYDFTGTDASFGGSFTLFLNYRSTAYNAEGIGGFIVGILNSSGTVTVTQSSFTGNDNSTNLAFATTGTPPLSGTLVLEIIDKAGTIKVGGTTYATFTLPGTLSTTQEARWQIGRKYATLDNLKTEVRA